MADWADKVGLRQLAGTIGAGGLTGMAVGGGLALLGAITGLTGGLGGWLSWLLVPAAAIAGGFAGGLIAKDGPMFGTDEKLRRRTKRPDISAEYVANHPDASTCAISSAVLAERGETLSMFSPDRTLDMKDDPRLERLKVKARGYRALFAGSTASTREREKFIADSIVEDIGKEYGEFSNKTLADHSNEEERRAVQHSDDVRLREIRKHDLVCRHYAPIASVLLHEAGVPNHLLCSYFNRMRKDRSSLFGMEFIESTPRVPHAYVITDQGNAVVEATVAGVDDADRGTYRPIINGVRWEDIVKKGTTAILDPHSSLSRRKIIYGGHNGDGGLANAASVEGVDQAMRESVERHNDAIHTAVRAGSVGNAIASPLNSLMNLLPNITPPKPAKEAAPKHPGK